MITRCIVTAFMCAVFLSATLAGADLTKVDRSIKKEPAYQTKSPKYCLLVFGPEAKTRVWLVLDGDTLYIDRNGNGDLTEEGERVPKQGDKFLAGDITEADGLTKHTNLVVETDSVSILLRGKCEQGTADRVYRSEQPKLQFADRPQNAPVVHFNGPLTLVLSSPTTIKKDIDRIRFDVYLGTHGQGQGTFAFVRETSNEDFPKVLHLPKDVFPVVEIEFPNVTPGEKPIKDKTKLRSYSVVFYLGSVRVPNQVASGKAKITLSFPDWKEVSFAPVTFEVPIEGPTSKPPGKDPKTQPKGK